MVVGYAGFSHPMRECVIRRCVCLSIFSSSSSYFYFGLFYSCFMVFTPLPFSMQPFHLCWMNFRLFEHISVKKDKMQNEWSRAMERTSLCLCDGSVDVYQAVSVCRLACSLSLSLSSSSRLVSTRLFILIYCSFVHGYLFIQRLQSAAQ